MQENIPVTTEKLNKQVNEEFRKYDYFFSRIWRILLGKQQNVHTAITSSII